MSTFNSFLIAFSDVGGLGGRAGNAFEQTNGATLNFNGAKTEAVLRTEGRLRGESDEKKVSFDGDFLNPDRLSVSQTGAGSVTSGYTFATDGTLTKIQSVDGNVLVVDHWSADPLLALFGDDYEVRIQDRSPDSIDSDTIISLTAEPSVDGTWNALTSARTWSLTTTTGLNPHGALFEIRRADFFNADEITDSLFLTFLTFHP